MRLTYFFALLFFNQAIYAQSPTEQDTVQVSPSFLAYMDKTYLDSVEIDTAKTYLDIDNILETKAIHTRSNEVYSTHRYAALIIRKVPNKLVSLGELSTRIAPKDSVRYIINDKYITDTSNVRIEVSGIDSINVIREAEGSVIREPKPVIINIKMKYFTQKRRSVN